jgi:hypothetical protein
MLVLSLAVACPAASAQSAGPLSDQLASSSFTFVSPDALAPAVSSSVVVVTTTGDVVNGDVSSVAALNANPGSDGISLREALEAANATGGSATVYIMFSASLNGQTIAPGSILPPVDRDNVVVEGIAPDGSPAQVTIDGRGISGPSASYSYGLLAVQASEVTVRWLRFTGVNPVNWAAAVLVGPGWEGPTGTPLTGPGGWSGSPTQTNVRIEDDVFDERGFTFSSSGAIGNGLIVSPGPALNGTSTDTSDVTIERNSFIHYTGEGDTISVARPPGHTFSIVTIEDNTFDDDEFSIEAGGTRIIGNTITTAINGAIGITVGANLPDTVNDGTLIEDNTIAAINGYAIDIGNASTTGGGDVISNTQIINNSFHVVSGNAIGIYIEGGQYTTSSPSSVTGVTVENDTLVDDGNGYLMQMLPNGEGASGNQITDVVMRNTIMWDPNGTPIGTGTVDGGIQLQSPDVVMNSLISGPGWAGSNGNINTDPEFLNETGGDYHLTAGSPAIDAGTTTGAPADDLDGALRDATPDIGAYEYGAVSRPLLTVTVDQLGGSGTVTSNPAGIACDDGCSSRFDPSTTVTLTAAPASGSVFAGWSGGGCSGTGSCTVSMSAAQTVTASFIPPPMHSLTITRSGSGSGTVSISPAHIDCGATCSYAFDSGTQWTLTATRATGSTFAGWSGGGCTGTGTCQVTMSSDTSVTATFTAQPVLTVHRAGTGTGTVTSSPAGIYCGATCTGVFSPGQEVKLLATSARGSAFAGWSGACTTSTTSCTVTLNGNATATATFLTRPAISKPSLTSRTFKAATSGASTAPASRRSNRGTRVRFTLNQAATIRFTIEHQLPGRKTGRGKNARCSAPTRRNRKAPHCTRTVPLHGGFTITGKKGANSFRFTGRFAGRTLAPGNYTLIAAPSTNGLAGSPVKIAFRISR